MFKKAFSLLPFGKGTPEGIPLIPGEKLPELTKDELRNGWTPESLARYRLEREKAAFKVVFAKAPEKQTKADSNYNPSKW